MSQAAPSTGLDADERHRFEAVLYEPRSSRGQPVRVTVNGAGIAEIADAEGYPLHELPWRDLTISARIGQTPRRLTLPSGHVLETADNDTVDRLELDHRGTTRAALVSALERHSQIVVVALLLCVIGGFGLVRYGIPYASDRIAYAMPAEILDETGAQTLGVLDRLALEPTELNESEQAELQALFDQLLTVADLPPERAHLVFRAAPEIGPNAFALPDGTVIITDELVALAEDQREVMAVMAHEIAHVEKRHSLRAFLRSSSTALLVVMMTGDLSGLTEFAAGYGAFALDMRYSRDFEREADARAVAMMQAVNEDPLFLAIFFQRIKDEVCEGDCRATWLSSHPDIQERIEAVENAR